ncbi:hypothetical protein ACFL0Q_01910 [Thermodesulfobacteriota bacterium]
MVHHYLEWKNSRLDIRCWACSAILVSISTQGSHIEFNSLAEEIEISCPECHSTCVYSMSKEKEGIFGSHDWDADIDSSDFDGTTGDINRELLREYKSILTIGGSKKIFMENEFPIVRHYLEVLSEGGIDASTKDDEIIDQYVNELNEYGNLSRNREKTIRRAINHLYRLLGETRPGSQQT